MQGFLLSIRVVTPILLMLCVGMLVRRLGWVDEKNAECHGPSGL